jgi:hypothetical protein
MSRRGEVEIRRQFGITTRLWYWMRFATLATELGIDERPCVVAWASHPPYWAMAGLPGSSGDQLGWLMATTERLVWANRDGKPRIVLPLGSIRAVEATPGERSPILTAVTDDERYEFGIHTDWPKRRAKTALAAFEQHLRLNL